MSVYLRLWAGYRLLAGKHTGILTHFQTKVNKNFCCCPGSTAQVTVFRRSKTPKIENSKLSILIASPSQHHSTEVWLYSCRLAAR
jgi:hypothetical protein